MLSFRLIALGVLISSSLPATGVVDSLAMDDPSTARWCALTALMMIVLGLALLIKP